MKKGQIAHLDGDPANNAPGNLAYLCFDHHDAYDSTTRQSKNYTLPEVRALQKELYAQIEAEWKKPATFQLLSTEPAGRYFFSTPMSSGEFQVSYSGDSRYRIEGFATWGSPAKGAHTGDLSFETALSDHRASFTDPASGYQLQLTFLPGMLIAAEENALGQFGLNVSFEGTYSKVA